MYRKQIIFIKNEKMKSTFQCKVNGINRPVNTFTTRKQNKGKRNERKTCLKEITNSYKIFRRHPVQSKQNKHIAGNIHSRRNRKKHTAKHN